MRRAELLRWSFVQIVLQQKQVGQLTGRAAHLQLRQQVWLPQHQAVQIIHPPIPGQIREVIGPCRFQHLLHLPVSRVKLLQT